METNIITGVADGPSQIIDASKSTTCQPVVGGATRQNHVAGQGQIPPRYDLITNNEVGFRRLAETFGEGAVKYGDHNWKKGLTESNLINHALAHLSLHVKGDTSEDHLSHACWNLYTLMWMQEKRPELMDIQIGNSGMPNPIEVAWAIIANAGGGDWGKERPDWVQAAEKWRDENITKK